MKKEYSVTPWEVKGKVDYDNLIKEFGVKPIDEKLLARLQKHTGDLHYFLKRKIFFAHTYLDVILDQMDKKEKFYLYTGRAPSGPVHLGHLISWMFCKWLQDKFGAHLLFQIPDEEKFLFKEGLSMEESKKWAYDNILDIIALGFDPKKTKIFLDTEYATGMYSIACEVAKKTTASTAKALFGLESNDNVGKYFYTCMQSVPAFLPTKLEGKPTMVLIPCAIDQDVHFRLTRDVAQKLGYPKPSTILCRFLPSLEGGGKLSTSSGVSIQTTDNPKTVEKKINKYAFSGGKDTIEKHRKEGGNPDIDISYQYLTYFMEDANKLKQVYNDYKAGRLLSGELKKIAIDEINKFLKEHQLKREKAKTQIEKFMLRS